MRHIIVGTAGHIDHGKTALVRALTGMETDRLAEEKRRGISIVLGFANLELSDNLRLGFVDVPGHERFIRNMLAGAGGIDMVLLVIAANESIMPQTREHLDICRLLGIRKGIVVVTKTDLVDAATLELVRAEVADLVRGSFLESAPVVPASARTGEGMESLRSHLARIAGEAQAKDTARHFRLPIDRAFLMKGFGAVVTGTLISGAVARGDEVEAQPPGVRLRVRRVEVHGQEIDRALAGQRTALNLAGPEVSKLAAGMMLAEPGRFHSTGTVDCRLTLLGSARPLKHHALVHFHAGTAKVIAEIRLLESSGPLEPGASAFVRILLRDPVLLLPEDRFIVRTPSPVTTIGGGVVLDIAPPKSVRRAAAASRLSILERNSIEERLLLLASETSYGVPRDTLVERTGIPAHQIEQAGRGDRFVAFPHAGHWLMTRERFAALARSLRTQLAAFHKKSPLLPGMPKEDLRACTMPDGPLFLLDELIRSDSELIQEAKLVRLVTHQIRLRGDEEGALDRIEAAFERAGLAVPATTQVLASCGVEAERARSLLGILLRQRRLVKVGDNLIYHFSAIEKLKQEVTRRKGERFSVAQFKQWTGVSRKYAIPLLEFLDRERVTLRQNDSRIVL